jgi:serine phosphatase RsbU (regulator of sigma subunit)
LSQPTADRLALPYRVSEAFNSSLDLDAVLTRVMDEVIAATRAERGFLMLYDADGKLACRAARGLDRQTIDAPEFQISRGLVERVARFYHRVDDGTGFVTHALMAAPLIVNERVIGVVEVSNKPGGFAESDLDLLSTIAGGAAIAIENARLYQIAVEKGRIERELQVAYEVQSSLLPAATPQIPGWEFAALWHPARTVGGDYYDFVPRVGAHSRAPLQGIIIGDVTDKGMPAALFMALTRSTVRASLVPGRSPAECITRANALIAADSLNGMFVSLFYAQLDSATGDLTYVNAGHNPPLRYRSAHGDLVELTRTGIVLGIERAFQFEQRTVTLARGDFVLLYTDGVTEAADAQLNEFGVERMMQMVLDNRTGSAGEIITAVKTDLDSFTKDVTQFDDITMVAVKRL